MKEILYVVGKDNYNSKGDYSEQLKGIYHDEITAIRLCQDEDWFIRQVFADEPIPKDNKKYYPFKK